MGLRDLVVLLDGSARDETKLAVAVELARRNDAHLTGLCPLELLLPADMSFALGGYPDLWALPEFARQLESQAKAKAGVIEETHTCACQAIVESDEHRRGDVHARNRLGHENRVYTNILTKGPPQSAVQDKHGFQRT